MWVMCLQIIDLGGFSNMKQHANDVIKTNFKQLLDEAFVISGIIKVGVSVISRAEDRGC